MRTKPRKIPSRVWSNRAKRCDISSGMVLSHGSTLVWTQILPARLPSFQTNGNINDIRNEESSHNAQDNHHNQDPVVIFRGRV